MPNVATRILIPTYKFRNAVPIITCSPWNPIATKNVDPYAESAIVNGSSKYSYACSAVKYSPNSTVMNIL